LKWDSSIFRQRSLKCSCSDNRLALADIGTNITSFVATATISYLFYEIPNPGKFILPPPNIVRRVQSEIPINGTGEHIFEINRGGMLVDLKAIYLMNAVRSDSDRPLRVSLEPARLRLPHPARLDALETAALQRRGLPCRRLPVAAVRGFWPGSRRRFARCLEHFTGDDDGNDYANQQRRVTRQQQQQGNNDRDEHSKPCWLGGAAWLVESITH
jgi:hypothetical protein